MGAITTIVIVAIIIVVAIIIAIVVEGFHSEHQNDNIQAWWDSLQDELHGKGQRVYNAKQTERGAITGYRCTVCRRETNEKVAPEKKEGN